MTTVRAYRRLLGRAGLMLAALALLAAAIVYGLSERALRRVWDVPLATVSVPTDAAAIAEGRRLATIRGCANGCHGKPGIGGAVFDDDRWYGRLVAPNLGDAVRRYSDAELARVIRHGIKRDGSAVQVMPSDMFAQLDDADLGAIIAFLRAEPAVEHALPASTTGPLLRWQLAFGAPGASFAAARIDHAAPHPPKPRADDARAWGRYLAHSTCTECHGADLRGIHEAGFHTPPLVAVAAYPLEDFRQLMRTGVALGGRTLNDLMTRVARERTSRFTDAEIDALHAYLVTLASAEP